MSRVVYVGGFGNGRSSAEHVASALEEYYEQIDPFTFSQAMQNPDMVRKAAHGVDAMTNSAGMLALVGTDPNRIDAFSAPLPTSRRRLVGMTVVKTARMHTPGIGIKSPQDVIAVARYDASSTAELAAHPLGNLGRLGQISRFDAVEAAIAARNKAIPVGLAYTDGDEYFQLHEDKEKRAIAGGVGVERMKGIHDELVIRPAAMLQAYLERSRM